MGCSQSRAAGGNVASSLPGQPASTGKCDSAETLCSRHVGNRSGSDLCVQKNVTKKNAKFALDSSSPSTLLDSIIEALTRNPKTDLTQLFPENPLPDFVLNIPAVAKEVELSAGLKYRGSWENAKVHGHGELKYPDGSSYAGVFADGRPHGPGIFVTRAGGKYRGTFVNGKAQGYGVYTFSDGTVYYGNHENDRREGLGREVQPDGLVYVGEYKKGNKNGRGILLSPTGEVYVGAFANGHIHGQGTYKWPDGRVYAGSWERNRQSGFAEFRWPDGKVYRGMYKDGKMAGKGVLEWPDGRKYDGEWRNGLQHGVGKYWTSPTECREAQFLEGVRVRWLGPLRIVTENDQSTSCQEAVAPSSATASNTKADVLTPIIAKA